MARALRAARGAPETAVRLAARLSRASAPRVSRSARCRRGGRTGHRAYIEPLSPMALADVEAHAALGARSTAGTAGDRRHGSRARVLAADLASGRGDHAVALDTATVRGCAGSRAPCPAKARTQGSPSFSSGHAARTDTSQVFTRAGRAWGFADRLAMTEGGSQGSWSPGEGGKGSRAEQRPAMPPNSRSRPTSATHNIYTYTAPRAARVAIQPQGSARRKARSAVGIPRSRVEPEAQPISDGRAKTPRGHHHVMGPRSTRRGVGDVQEKVALRR